MATTVHLVIIAPATHVYNDMGGVPTHAMTRMGAMTGEAMDGSEEVVG